MTRGLAPIATIRADDRARGVRGSRRALGEERARGDAFEAAVLRWLTNEPELGFRAAWLWAVWPERVRRAMPASDDGIDLVAEDLDGDLVAIQAKFRSNPLRPITREEAQPAHDGASDPASRPCARRRPRRGCR
jgi:hypothetical protein